LGALNGVIASAFVGALLLFRKRRMKEASKFLP
jgi:hypothetical protein